MRPIFIGGTGRSGTTILRRVLAGHPHVSTLPQELRLIVDPNGALDLIHALSDGWSPYAADSAIHSFIRFARKCESRGPLSRVHNLARRMGIAPRSYAVMRTGADVGKGEYRDAVTDLVERISVGSTRATWVGSASWQLRARIYETRARSLEEVSVDVVEFLDAIYRARAQGREVSHWVEDTPFNLCHAERLSRVFPHSRLLHIYRDPRDVVASYLQQMWGGGAQRPWHGVSRR